MEELKNLFSDEVSSQYQQNPETGLVGFLFDQGSPLMDYCVERLKSIPNGTFTVICLWREVSVIWGEFRDLILKDGSYNKYFVNGFELCNSIDESHCGNAPYSFEVGCNPDKHDTSDNCGCSPKEYAVPSDCHFDGNPPLEPDCHVDTPCVSTERDYYIES